MKLKGCQEIVEAEADTTSPPKKKLKQARLPFQVLSPVVSESEEPKSKKRKLNEETAPEEEAKKVVAVKDSALIESKENICKPVKETSSSVVVIDDNSSDSAFIITPGLSTDVSFETEKDGNSQDEKIEENETLTNNHEGDEANELVLIEDGCAAAGKDISLKRKHKAEETASEDTSLKRKHKAEETASEDTSPKRKHKAEETASKDSSTKVKSDTTLNSPDSSTKSVTLVENSENDITNPNSVKSENPSSEETPKKVKSDASTNSTGSSPKSVTSDENVDNGKASPNSTAVNTSDNSPDSSSKSVKVDDNLRRGDVTPSSVGRRTSKNVSPNTPKDSPPAAKKLTPKQLLKQKESAKKREEKEKLRLENKRKKAEEKEEKQRQKQEKEELKKREKEEKEEQKKKEKEEKEKKRLAELEIKLEEKKQKEEEKRKKEEQKKKKDEKKQLEEDLKRKEAAAFSSFFLQKKSEPKQSEEIKDKPLKNFMPFEVKRDMRLAPITRVSLSKDRKQQLEKHINQQNQEINYLKDLRSKVVAPGKSSKTWPLSEFQADIIILDPEDEIVPGEDNQVIESHPDVKLPRLKLIQFWDNRRPAYWGTWRKPTKELGPRHPFKKDEKLFDYEVDSDDEWEEEEPGESLHGSDDEKESEDEYEVDNDFFVPHGYLSDEENVHGEEDGDEQETISPESQKAKLKILELEFEEEMKQKTERIKPRIIGCVWAHKKDDPVAAQLLKLLSSRRAIYCENEGPIIISGQDDKLDCDKAKADGQQEVRSTKKKKKKFPDSFIQDLIKLIHGNTNSALFLVKEFYVYCNKQKEKVLNENGAESPVGVSKSNISSKMKELASWTTCTEEGPLFKRFCWFVPSETRAAYGLEDLTATSKSWDYNLTPKRKEIVTEANPVTPALATGAVVGKSSPVLITKFTKKLSQEERQKQLQQQMASEGAEAKPKESPTAVSTSQNQPVKKRVPILFSSPRGQPLAFPKNDATEEAAPNNSDVNSKSPKVASIVSKLVPPKVPKVLKKKRVSAVKVKVPAKPSPVAGEPVECIDLSD